MHSSIIRIRELEEKACYENEYVAILELFEILSSVI